MRWPWQGSGQRRNGAVERKLLADTRKSGEAMAVMVDRLDLLVQRLNKELARYEEQHELQGGGGDDAKP